MGNYAGRRRGKERTLVRLPASRNLVLLIAIAVLAAVVGLSITGGVALEFTNDQAVASNRAERILIRRIEVALAETDAATLGFVLTSQPEFLSTFFRTEKLVATLGPPLLARLAPPGATAGRDVSRAAHEALSMLREA